ncbi:MAG: HAMP domain-containing protein [Rhodospirillales bacterium]|nr:HAMP domain-containing protein [Rhodospirillales bacterium]MSP79956.1 HAMP domain-containing protein [Rhodospirillales bacterium]
MDSGTKRFLPKTLLGRTLAILITPLAVVQLVSATVFYDTHWDKIMARLAQGVAGDISMLIQLLPPEATPETREWMFELFAGSKDMVVSFQAGAILAAPGRSPSNWVEESLDEALAERVARPFAIDAHSHPRLVTIEVQLSYGVLRALVPRKRLFSSTAIAFGLWTVGSSLILLGIAVVFMRNQVKPIRRLALAAENFGKGRDMLRFKPEGASEVRQAAAAFQAMRERIQRQIAQRTAMLSGVSHDLRTPLARMKLQLEMLAPGEGIAELKADVVEMERMLEEYLAFARGEGTEAPASLDLGLILEDAVQGARREGRPVTVRTEGDLVIPVRPSAIRRAIANVMANALRHGRKVEAVARRADDWIEITIDDDGPGVPPESREDVFRPFYRLDPSRNPETGGVGLGLAIVRDILRGHGGDATLEGSHLGGVRARLRLPV